MSANEISYLHESRICHAVRMISVLGLKCWERIQPPRTHITESHKVHK